MELVTLGDLKARVVGPRGAPAVLLCHGFGAPGDDLVPLAEALDPHSTWRWIFPEAPLDLSTTMGFPGRAWWLIDFEQVQAISQKSKEALLAFRQNEPEGMARARSLLTGLVDVVQAQSGLSLSRFVLGGFSQGAMITTDVALRLDEAPLGLVAMSGTLLLEDLWTAKAKARPTLPVFQSHGRQDPLLPFWVAERMRDLFQEAGMPVTWVPFDGGHGIGLEALRGLARFLAERLKSLSA